jgi:hypothetical protein
MDIGSVNRRSVVYGHLADHKNYRETSWSGNNGEAWAFDVNHRGMPPINADQASRTKRHVIHLTDVHGVPTGQSMLVMPKNILGLYSDVKADWDEKARLEAIAEANQEARNAQINAVQEATGLEVQTAEASITRGISTLLGRQTTYADAYPSLSVNLEWNADETVVRGKVEGTVRLSYDVYLRLMEYAFEGVDAQ